MASKSTKSNPGNGRKRVEAESTVGEKAAPSLLRARDGSAFARCEECKKDVPVVLIDMHSCSLDAKIRSHLASQVVEQPAEAKKKPAERKKSTTTAEPKAKRAKKGGEKKSNDPNKPKRPPTAFFLFMDDFRKTYKEENPDSKSVSEVAKKGGEKWKSMEDEEKKVYQDKAAELKAEYTKALESNNAEPEAEDDVEGSGSDKEVAENTETIVEKEVEAKDDEENLDDY